MRKLGDFIASTAKASFSPERGTRASACATSGPFLSLSRASIPPCLRGIYAIFLRSPIKILFRGGNGLVASDKQQRHELMSPRSVPRLSQKQSRNKRSHEKTTQKRLRVLARRKRRQHDNRNQGE